MNAETKSKGFPLCPILGLIFITLKLCGVIGWSWWLVTLPIWLWFGLFLGVVGCLLAFVALAGLASLVVAMGVGIRKLFSK